MSRFFEMNMCDICMGACCDWWNSWEATTIGQICGNVVVIGQKLQLRLVEFALAVATVQIPRGTSEYLYPTPLQITQTVPLTTLFSSLSPNKPNTSVNWTPNKHRSARTYMLWSGNNKMHPTETKQSHPPPSKKVTACEATTLRLVC